MPGEKYEHFKLLKYRRFMVLSVRRDQSHPLPSLLIGEEYGSFAVLRDGHIRAITTFESSPSQLNYQHIDVPEITEWVKKFTENTPGITGQLCFDFIIHRQYI